MLAGHQYKVSNQRHHSIRNYLNAQEVIQDKGWKQAELHVNEIIGIHALQLGDKIKVKVKVGCVFPMVISSEFRMGWYRDDYHQEGAPHFTLETFFGNMFLGRLL